MKLTKKLQRALARQSMVDAMNGEPIKGNIIAIDPGTTHSAVLAWSCGVVENKTGFFENKMVGDVIADLVVPEEGFTLVIEGIQSYGKPVGQETFDTCVWIGRFIEIARRNLADHHHLIYRPAIKAIVCGTTQSTDADVRASLLRLFPATGGGATPQVGTKAQPGPLYAISGHLWSALAVAVAFSAQPTEPLT